MMFFQAMIKKYTQDIDFSDTAQFVLSKEHQLMKVRKPTDEERRSLVLPFPRCAFEVEGGWDSALIDPTYTGVRAIIKVIWLEQTGLGKFKSLVQVNDTIADVRPDNYEQVQFVTGFAWSIVNLLLPNNQLAELEPPAKKNKYKFKGRTYQYRPSTCIYIGGAKGYKKKSSAPKNIKRWVDAWQVRGHWRKLPEGRVGHDPWGKAVEGQTWVSPHTKGTGQDVARKIYKLK